MAEEKDKSKEKDMEKEYDTLKKKYNLPELKELDKEFCVGKLEDAAFILRGITDKMIERFGFVIKIINDIINPESNYTSMLEAEAFSDEEKKMIFNVLKKTAYHERELVLLDFDYSDEAAAIRINNTLREWKEIKKDFIKIVSKLKDAWKNDVSSKVDEAYFG